MRHTTVGRALPGYEFRSAGGEPDGTPGELQVRGPYVTPGYLERPEETAEAFDGEWFRTGDLGSVDEQGYIRIEGRAKEVVHVGGFNVFPAEVEAFFLTHPDVAQVVVVGVPHERMGEALAAFVVPRPGVELEPAALLRFARPKIAGYKLPYAIRVLAELPLPADRQARSRCPAGERARGRRRRRAGAMRNATSFEGIAVPVSALAGVPLFDGPRTGRARRPWPPSMRFREFGAGEVIVREGQPGESMLVILEGLANELAVDGRLAERLARARSSRRGAWWASCVAATCGGDAADHRRAALGHRQDGRSHGRPRTARATSSAS